MTIAPIVTFVITPKKTLLYFFFIWRLAFSRFCCIRYSNTDTRTHTHTLRHTLILNLTRCTYNIYAYRNFNASLWMKIYELAFPWSCALFSCACVLCSEFSFSSSWISGGLIFKSNIWNFLFNWTIFEFRMFFLSLSFTIALSGWAELSWVVCASASVCLWYVNWLLCGLERKRCATCRIVDRNIHFWRVMKAHTTTHIPIPIQFSFSCPSSFFVIYCVTHTHI